MDNEEVELEDENNSVNEQPDVEQPNVVEESLNESKRNKKKKTRFFETYIFKLLKNISLDHGITSNAKQQLNNALCTIAKTISKYAIDLTFISKKKTMSIKEVENAVKFLFSGIMLESILSSSNSSVYKFGVESNLENNTEIESDLTGDTQSGDKQSVDKHVSRQNKAGIVFPPSICEKFLRNFGSTRIMVTKTAPVFLACVLDYVCKFILKRSTDLAKENNKVRLTIRELELSVRGDKDLEKLFDNCGIWFIGGGVVPNIHEALLNKKTKKKKKTAEMSQTLGLTDKIHRFRPGTVSLREIRKFQKANDCLTFSKDPFERSVRSIVNKVGGEDNSLKISKETFIVLQYYIEQFLIDFLQDTNLASIHGKRVKLMPSDIEFISKLRKYDIVFDIKKEIETDTN
jgi:histone H3/H4